MLVDYHMHLERDDYKGRGRFTLERIGEYVQVARRRGIDEIAVTEHVHRFREFRPLMEPLLTGEGSYPEYREWADSSFRDELDEYVTVLTRAKAMGWPVKIGLEVDWIPGREEDIARILQPYPWDVLLGSVHFLGTWCIDFSPHLGWPERDADEAVESYYTELARAASSGLFDVLAHPDLVKKFRPKTTVPLEPLWRMVARSAAAAGCSVEVSTAGLFKPAAEMYPSQRFLRLFREEGVSITLASDAHEPEHVGRAIREAAAWARGAGYEELAVFDGRKRRLEPLG